MIFGEIDMSWFDILKQTMDVAAINRQRESESQKRLREKQQQLAPQAAQYRTRFQETPASFAPATEEEKRRAESIGGFEPTLQREYKQRMEDEQRKLEEAWAEKQRELQTQRSSANNARIDQLNQTLDSTKRDVKILLSKIKQKQAQGYQQLADNLDRQKFENIKNKLKEAGLNNLLAQVEAVENMAEGRFSE